MTFRCAAASEERSESLAGSASTVSAFLLVEHPGPWGVDALRDARLPDGLGDALRERTAGTRTKVLLVRRPDGSSKDGAGVHVFAAWAHHQDPWLEATVLDDITDVLDLDLGGLGHGRSLGLPRRAEPVYAVCTHGRHDACCAERGRPVAAGLAEAFPEQTWEASHVGGDRFSANLVVLPHGLYYGRLEPDTARGLARLVAAGELDLDHLRGRSGYATPLQAAEIALRRWTDERRLDGVRFVSRRSQDGRTDAVLAVEDREYAVTVLTSRAPEPTTLTCRATRDSLAARHEVTEIRAL